jgi:hypothetical protein
MSERAPVLHDQHCARGQIFPGERRPYDHTCSRCLWLLALIKNERYTSQVPEAVRARRARAA